VVLGGYVLAAALSTRTGSPVLVGGAVSVQPLPGWQVAETSPVNGFPFARLTRGGGNLDVVMLEGFSGDATELARTYEDEVLKRQLNRLSVPDTFESVTLADGTPAVRYRYVGVTDTGASIEGEVTAVVAVDGRAVVFDGWAPQGLLTFVEGDIHDMVDRAVLM
jgi:hypothetical protein